jgi:hypothetical protein
MFFVCGGLCASDDQAASALGTDVIVRHLDIDARLLVVRHLAEGHGSCGKLRSPQCILGEQQVSEHGGTRVGVAQEFNRGGRLRRGPAPRGSIGSCGRWHENLVDFVVKMACLLVRRAPLPTKTYLRQRRFALRSAARVGIGVNGLIIPVGHCWGQT